MNQYNTERYLCCLYSLVAVALGVSIICLAVPYTHWRATLDVCPGTWLENTNCGCILFGVSTFQYFNGGHNSKCLYAILAPLPILVYAVIMALFHMYRVCINNIGQFEDKSTATMEQFERESIVINSRMQVSHSNDGIIHCWIPTSVITALFCVYNLAHSIITTMGFMKTCSQYRSYLVRELHATGDHSSAIHFRLDCQAIFDFMDYLQKDAPNNRRGDYINTGVSLQIALVTSWLAVAFWIVVVILNAKRAHAERDVLSCY